MKKYSIYYVIVFGIGIFFGILIGITKERKVINALETKNFELKDSIKLKSNMINTADSCLDSLFYTLSCYDNSKNIYTVTLGDLLNHLYENDFFYYTNKLDSLQKNEKLN